MIPKDSHTNSFRSEQIGVDEFGHIVNIAHLTEKLSRFSAFVQHIDRSDGFISFRNSAGFLGREEDYKTRIAEEARKELNFSNWSESWIGTGRIADCARKAMNKSGNLVNMHSRIDFSNRLDSSHSEYRQEAERVLYDIYRNPLCDEATAFAEAKDTFSGTYSVIAFLFYIKDDSRFLPISPSHFDKSFRLLKIAFKTSHHCSWENYQKFISIIREIREVMQEFLPMEGIPRLIDAHSLVWILQQDRFIDWVPDGKENIQIERATEAFVSGSGGRRSVVSNAFIRSADVVKETRKRANGICQYCKQPAPFKDKKGNPYLEVHHVKWLSRGGEDSTNNTVALCPNCHTRMHFLDDPKDVEQLIGLIEMANHIKE